MHIYTTINFTKYSVTEVGALSAAGWEWPVRGRHTLRWEVGMAGWAWLFLRGIFRRRRCTGNRPEWPAWRDGSVHSTRGILVV